MDGQFTLPVFGWKERERGGMCGLKDIPRLYKARKRLAGRIKRRQANFSCAQAVRNDMIMAHKKEGEEKKTARLNLTHRRRSKCRDGTQISRWCKIVHIHEQFSVVHRRWSRFVPPPATSKYVQHNSTPPDNWQRGRERAKVSFNDGWDCAGVRLVPGHY